MENNLFIAYDLRDFDKNYPKIDAAIRALGQAIPIQFSLYYLKTRHTCHQAAQLLLGAIDENDSLIVIDAKDAAFFNLIPGSQKFIQDRWSA